MEHKPFNKFLLQEGLRQDSLVHSTASQLGTKSGLFMVFAAFIFTAESSFAGLGTAVGFNLPRWPLLVALILALLAIGVLLWSSRLLSYRMPPILPELRQQSERFFNLSDIKRLPENEQMDRLEEKFVNSLTRSVTENFRANSRISKSLLAASVLISLSLSCLFLSLIWAVAQHALAKWDFGLF